ncbi:MerR family transcriptional regulator [Phenylobacterium sp.]|uniref:MerR family transcriptional regulator n=1 Tax=Phenylobacterium sp. TaxID=1871053 RepID=UPI00374C9862
MNIGEAARVSGVSTKMIRYYEQIALIRPADRTDGNYRNFSERDVTDLKFIRRARSLGFSTETIADLLTLWCDNRRPRADIEAIVAGHVSELRLRISELQGMVDTLLALADRQGEEGRD